MNYDISESVSQRGDGAYDEENRRIQEVSNELQRLCRLHEEESGDGKRNGTRFEIEQRVAEQYAKEHGIWIPMDNVFDLGTPGPSGNELIFPNTAYKIHGFTGYDGRTIMPVLEQERICESQPATQIMIDTYMAALGFERDGETGRFKSESYRVWDVVPRNVLVDKDGDMYVIDAEIARNQ